MQIWANSLRKWTLENSAFVSYSAHRSNIQPLIYIQNLLFLLKKVPFLQSTQTHQYQSRVFPLIQTSTSNKPTISYNNDHIDDNFLLKKFIIMNRNYQVSKQTVDKVKLAKQFIESRYKAILQREEQQKIGWQKIMQALAPFPEKQKRAIAVKALAKESTNTRLLRVKRRLQDYDIMELIGKGAFGQVRLARCKLTKQVVAIKRMAKSCLADKKQLANVFLEKECLSRSNSKWLVQLKSAFQDKKYLYIAMEWVPGGDLLRLLIEKDIFSEKQTRFYVCQLIIAIEEMHKMNYIHRDIKPDNILISSSGHIKLTDFGLSKELELAGKSKKYSPSEVPTKSLINLKRLKAKRQRQFSKVGTPDYIAPQILTQQSYDHRVDIWSVGVIMFQCLFGFPPFSHEDSREVCMKVMHWEDHLSFPQTPKVSIEAKLLILGMLSPKEHRLTIQQIKQHPFFLGFEWEKILQMDPPFTPQLAHEFDTNNFDKFDKDQVWQQPSPRPTVIQRQNHMRRSSSVGYQYNFAGFDWQPSQKTEPFEQTLKEIKDIQTVNPRQPIFNAMKRMKTDHSQLSSNKGRDSNKVRHSVKVLRQKNNRDEKMHFSRKIGYKGKCLKTEN